MESFGGETRIKQVLGRIRRRWGDNIKIDIKEPEWMRDLY